MAEPLPTEPLPTEPLSTDPLPRQGWDPFALVAGVVALVCAGLFLLDDLSWLDVPLRALWPASLLVLGIAFGVGSWLRWRRRAPV